MAPERTLPRQPEAPSQGLPRWIKLDNSNLAKVVGSQREGSWLGSEKTFLPNTIYFPSAPINAVEELAELLYDQAPLQQLREQRPYLDFSFRKIVIKGHKGTFIFIAYPQESSTEDQNKLLKAVEDSTRQVNTDLKRNNSSIFFPEIQ